LGTCLPDQVLKVAPVLDLVDKARAQFAGRPVDAGRATLPALSDHLPGTGVELLTHPLHPEIWSDVHLRILGTHLGEDDKILRKLGYELELSLAGDLDRPIRDLDVREAELVQPRLELLELVARVDRFEQRAAADDGRVE